MLASPAMAGDRTPSAEAWRRFLRVSDEVRDALASRRPVVALESTLITHGLPYPENARVAEQAEAAIRAVGAVPATVAVADGCVRVGLDDRFLETLATTTEPDKVSRSSLAAALAGGRLGGTTVSATMLAAAASGIEVFATGGIGGVHRGHPEDVSADVGELARTPVVVVSAGPKAILDVAATLEHLETRGVPVITLGAGDVPGFYSRSSGIASPLVADDVPHLARIARTHLDLFGTGVLACVPIPEAAEIPRERIAPLIVAAIEEADAAGISGARLTPWLLARLADASAGESVRANVALIVNNARVAGLLAARLLRGGVPSPP